MTTKTTPIEDFQEGINLMGKAFDSFRAGFEKLDLVTVLKALEAEQNNKEEAKKAKAEPKTEVKAEVKAEAKPEPKTEAKPAVKVQKDAKPKAEAKEPEVAQVPGEAPTLDLIRKLFAQIFLDTTVKGKIMLQSIIEKYNATKISEVNPDQYGALLREAVTAYRDALEKSGDKEIDSKLEGMNEWLIPF